MLAAGYADESVRLWDPASGKVRWTKTLGAASRIGDARTESWARVSFLPGGKALVGWHGGTMDVWDAATGKLLLELEGEWSDASALTFSPDGKMMAGWRKGSVHLWEIATGKEGVRAVLRVDGHRSAVAPIDCPRKATHRND